MTRHQAGCKNYLQRQISEKPPNTAQKAQLETKQDTLYHAQRVLLLKTDTMRIVESIMERRRHLCLSGLSVAYLNSPNGAKCYSPGSATKERSPGFLVIR